MMKLELWQLIATIIGTILTWDFGKWLFFKLTKREKEAEVKGKEVNVKQDEVEVVRKIIDEILQPTIERQKNELEEVRAENKTLRANYDTLLAKYDSLSAQVKDCTDSRDECHKMLATLKDEIARLQRSRDNRGRYAKEFRPVTKEVKDAVDA